MNAQDAGKDARPIGMVPLSRQDWRLIFILALVQFTHIVDFVIIMPLGLRLMSELEMTPSQFSWVVSSYGLAAAMASVLAASVFDRIDRKTILLLMYAGFTVSTLFCGLADSYERLLLARGLAGMFGGLTAATIMAVIGDAFPAEKRGRAAGAVMSAFAVASIAGLPLGLILANHYGWGAPFLALAAVCVVIWFAVWRELPNFDSHLDIPRNSLFGDYWTVIREPRHLLAFLWTAVLVHGTFTIIPFLGPYLTANAGRSDSDLPIIYAFAGFCTLITMNLIGRFSDRFGKRLLFRIMAIMALLVTLAVTNMPPVPLAVAALISTLFMIGASGRMIPAQAMMIGSASPAVRGSFLSMNTAVQHLATGVAPMIGGALMSRGPDGTLIGYPTVGLVAAGFALLSLLLSVWIHPAPADSTGVATNLTGEQTTPKTESLGTALAKSDSKLTRTKVTLS